jgi:hypothetical protein
VAKRTGPGGILIPVMFCPRCGAQPSVYRDSWRCNACGLTSSIWPKVAQELRAQLGTPASRESDRGNFALLKGKAHVNFAVAGRYLGIGRRAVEKAAKKGSLTAMGRGQGRRITVISLTKYLPPLENAD